MIKIKETDFLWKCYLGNYRNRYVPHPDNLINYYFNSMTGAIKIFFLQLNVLIPTFSLLFLSFNCYLITRAMEAKEHFTFLEGLFFIFLNMVMFGSIVFSVILCIERWLEYWNKKNKLIFIISIIVLLSILYNFGFILCVYGFENWTWWNLLYSFLTEVGLFAGFVLCVVFVNLLGAFMENFAVDPPQSWKDNENYLDRNRSDG